MWGTKPLSTPENATITHTPFVICTLRTLGSRTNVLGPIIANLHHPIPVATKDSTDTVTSHGYIEHGEKTAESCCVGGPLGQKPAKQMPAAHVAAPHLWCAAQDKHIFAAPPAAVIGPAGGPITSPGFLPPHVRRPCTTGSAKKWYGKRTHST